MTIPPIAVSLVNSSTGELHCLLPIMALARSVEPSLRFIVVFRDRNTRALLAQDPVYSAILDELGAELIHTNSLVHRVLTRRQQVRIIFKDFTATREGSLATLLKRVCPNAALVLFPHAYTLHSTGQDAAAAESRSTRKDFDERSIDHLLLNSPLDVENFSKKVPAEKIRVVGATGYTEWWAAILRRHARTVLTSVTQVAGDRKIVFMTTRGPHEIFLSEENYHYLVTNALETILSHPDVLVVLKPHPREDIAKLRALLASYPKDRVQLTALNTLALSSIATVTVSFWSSALLDSLAAGSPTIEFHRYHRPIPQSVLDADGNVASIYTTLGLSLKADSRDTLAAALDTALSQREALLDRQRAALACCFRDNEAQLDTLRGLIRGWLAAPAHRTSATAIFASALRIVRASARDLLEELRERRSNHD